MIRTLFGWNILSKLQIKPTQFTLNNTKEVPLDTIEIIVWNVNKTTQCLRLDSGHCIGFLVEVDGSMDSSIPTDLVEAKENIWTGY